MKSEPSAEVLLLWVRYANSYSQDSFSTGQDVPACSPLPFAVNLSTRVADMFANTRRLGFDFEELFVEIRLRNKKLK